MFQRYFLIIFCLVFFGLGCSESKPEQAKEEHEVCTRKSELEHSPVVPEFGGRIILGITGEPSNLIPPLATDSASHEVADLIYVAPLKYDKNIQLKPWAAQEFRVLDQGKRLYFRMRPGIKWFDGHELTAEDVYFTYKLMIDPRTPTAYAEDYKAIKEFKLIDKYSFEVVYDQPFARSLVTWAGAILPKHILEKEDLLKTRYSREPVGAGPYKLVAWEPGRKLVLRANKNYFEGRPYLDEVVYRIIPDSATMFLELKAGNLDMMGLSPQQFLFQTRGKFWKRNFNKYKYLSFSYTYLGYNLEHPLFKNVKVRRALAHAINKQEIVKGVLLGQGVPTIGPYKPGTWVYNKKIRDYSYNPELARKMLAEEGWIDHDGDGIIDKDGRPFAFTILTNQGNDLRVKAATIIQYRLGKIGIKVKIRTVEWATFIQEFVQKRRFEALILGWNIVQDPDIYDVWHSSRALPGGLNFIGYKNKEVDELLEKGRRTFDQKKRKAIYDRLQEILHHDQPYCFLYVPMSLPIVNSRFQGIEPAPAGITHNFIRWWVKQ